MKYIWQIVLCEIKECWFVFVVVLVFGLVVFLIGFFCDFESFVVGFIFVVGLGYVVVFFVGVMMVNWFLCEGRLGFFFN